MFIFFKVYPFSFTVLVFVLFNDVDWLSLAKQVSNFGRLRGRCWNKIATSTVSVKGKGAHSCGARLIPTTR